MSYTKNSLDVTEIEWGLKNEVVSLETSNRINGLLILFVLCLVVVMAVLVHYQRKEEIVD